jgi:hypothetical protein
MFLERGRSKARTNARKKGQGWSTDEIKQSEWVLTAKGE